MEEIDTCSKDKNTGEDIPQIPIKTYQWEDVRRARRKGGYPWTHLTKPPFEEEVDAEMFTMDAYRRSRSSSTLTKSDILDISEETDMKELSQDRNQESLVVGAHKSVDDNEDKPLENTKDESNILTSDSVALANTTGDNKGNLLNISNSQDIRASSEGLSKKRRPSIESSHSRISWSKLAIRDKLKNAKEKLKIPTIVKRSKSDVQEGKKPKVQKTEHKKPNYHQVTSEPVYIHIPLKLPPGETDEYSKYESESPRHGSRSASLTNLQHFGSGKRKMSLLGLLTELKRIYDEQVLASESRNEPLSEETSSANANANKSSQEKLKSEKINDPIRKHKTKKATNKSAHEVKEMLAASSDAYSVDSDINQYLEKDDKYEIITTEVPNLDIDCVIITDYDAATGDEASNSKLKEPSEWNTINLEKDFRVRVRAKSEEPTRKRKSSIDSSYSRKSLSKLEFMKKVKAAKDSIKLPKFLSFSKLDSKSSKITPDDKKEQIVEKQTVPKKIEHRKPEMPLYIHIPLKLPEGKTDEFSHLTNIDTHNKQVTNSGNNAEEASECETPISPVVPENDVHLIYLTPPSDEEILDPSIPETPSECDKKFFESVKVDELKCIAKKAVDMIYPNHKHLDVVLEDVKNEQDLQEGIQCEGTTKYWQMQPVLVDVEDGLKLSDAAIAMINEEMAKELDEKEAKHDIIPHIKKKVSFRRSKAQDGERIYEDVDLSTSSAKNEQATTSEAFRSMSTDEEKSYQDEKVMKTTSLDDDYNKWSKITDHEYEPVNPPLEEVRLPSESFNTRSNFTLHTSDAQLTNTMFNEKLQQDSNLVSSTEPPSAQDFQDQIEDRFLKSSKVTPPKIDVNIKQTSQTPTINSDNKRRSKPTQKSSTGTNFNEAIRTQADKIKTKLQGIRKPNINLPQRPKFPTEAFSKLKFKKPTLNMPKMPEMPSINFASLSLPRKDASKNSWRKRQYSTESNAGDSKTKKFDFKTYPRLFNKSKVMTKKNCGDGFEETTPSPVFATVPRTRRSKVPNDVKTDKSEEPQEYYFDKTRGLVTIPIDPDNDSALHIPSRIRYNQDINTEDGFNGSGVEEDTVLPRLPLVIKTTTSEWNEANTGKNHLNLDSSDDRCELQSDHSSASLSEHRQGVIEEIDSDQFFLREKGISQDDIDVGKYLSSEIKEAFRNPISALAQFQSEDREYDVDNSGHSQSSDEIPRKKWLKKPKRKKTPHVSNEKLSLEFCSDNEDFVTRSTAEISATIPSRPKRRSRKGRRNKSEPKEIVPFQEAIIPHRTPIIEPCVVINHQEWLPYDSKEYIESSDTYKNESDTKEERFEAVTPFYANTQDEVVEVVSMYINTWQNPEVVYHTQPIRPARRNKSLKSLSASAAGMSIDRNDESVEKSINSFDVNEPEQKIDIQTTAPTRPNRKRSHTRSESATSLRDEDPRSYNTPPTRPLRFRSRTRSVSTPSIQDHENRSSTTPPTRPNRLRSRTRSTSTESLHGSQNIELILNNSFEVPCVEEPCIQIVCDRMGYAVVDKTKIRDPPLPPSRFPKTPPRTRRKNPPIKTDKFATVPRTPQRPVRNYSTLTKKSSNFIRNGNILSDDDKENVDVNPYIEIDEEELAHRLQSGDIIQKMRERPLPAPPRPPRKGKTPNREVFKDISHERNLPDDVDTLDSKHSERIELSDTQLFELEQQILTDDHEETITHAALVVQPIGRSPATSHSDVFSPNGGESTSLSNERIIIIEREQTPNNSEEHMEHLLSTEPVSSDIIEEQQCDNFTITTETKSPEEVRHLLQEQDSDDEDISEVPEEFHRFKTPETEVTNTEKFDESVANLNLQLLDIDQIKSTVVPELEDVNMNVSEAGNLVISGIELSQNEIQREQDVTNKDRYAGDFRLEEHDVSIMFNEGEPPPVPPRSDSVSNLVDVITTDGAGKEDDFTQESQIANELPSDEASQNITETVDKLMSEPPVRPPRKASQAEKQIRDLTNLHKLQDDNLDETEDYVYISSHEATPESTQEADATFEGNDSNTHPTKSDLRYQGVPARQLPLHEEARYINSQPPLSFYNLVSPDDINEINIPLSTHCGTCRRKLPLSRSSSSEELSPRQNRSRRLSEPSIPQLTGQLVQSCAVEVDALLRNLLRYLTDNFLHNEEGKHDLQVMLLMLVVLIASLILMNSNDKVEHHHHWEYFNPPREF